MNVSLCFQRLRKLKERLISINSVVSGTTLGHEVEALEDIIQFIAKTQFTNIILVIGHPESFTDIELPTTGFFGCDTLAMCSINPSKFESSLLKKYFLPPDSNGRFFSEKEAYEIPFSWLCDRYYPTCDKMYKYRKAIFMEGLVSNDNLTEYGHKGVKEGLLSWLHRFYLTAQFGDPSNQKERKGDGNE